MKCILATALAAILSMPAIGIAECTPMEMESPRSVTIVICDGEIPIIERKQKPQTSNPQSTQNLPPHIIKWLKDEPKQQSEKQK